jgi:hypothetical protein
MTTTKGSKMEAFGYLLELSTCRPATATTHAALLDAYQTMSAMVQECGEETPKWSLSGAPIEPWLLSFAA